ncbi:MAG: hypothetical protein A3K19_27830 [Lentisphaerae bacterium RIFOXYB12_FULL_65_16]|nr:MAG: hypothetical protein A3K18_17750 [Lentisphaerae bacterium RIFOXYA12_64_32]OGV88201.1 MAG: hypothetical protein A3K19_27830 [Lentisphaerae bacterium RIFOXYB12_FULL_65_16]
MNRQAPHPCMPRLPFGSMLLPLWLALALLPAAIRAQDSLCARVKIEIEQELTLERQAFDARMKITNGTTFNMEDVGVDVLFSDENGTPVLASSDPNNTQALFFIRVDDMDNITNVSGDGTVEAGKAAEIHWLIIPAPGAGGQAPQGVMYYIGATLSYTLGGDANETEVTPDYVFVKPMPMLNLDYFLPYEVYGDDPFTLDTEAAVPFGLGVRIKNDGFGPAKAVKIDSGQPKIVENEQGLLIAFRIHGSTVNGQPASTSLLADFGDIASGSAGTARWIMTSSLYGHFVEFDATFSHADELGGQLTSLIDNLNTHRLVHDVLVDLNGRDTVEDWLATDGSAYNLYESEGLDTGVMNQSDDSTLAQTRTTYFYTLATPVNNTAFVYVKKQLTNSLLFEKVLSRVVREDGKIIKPQNAWVSKTWNNTSKIWEYFLNLFDFHGEADRGARTDVLYTVEFGDTPRENQPPVMADIPAPSFPPGETRGFMVTASDPDGTPPVLEVDILPGGASFIDNGNGTGDFLWTPVASQRGSYSITFTAYDSQDRNLSDSKTVNLSVRDSVPFVAFEVASSQVSEGEPLSYKRIKVLVDMDHPDTIEVPYSVGTGGTAVLTDDYTLDAPQTLTFAPGDREKEITVHLVNDTLDEKDETVILTLGTPTQGSAVLGTPITHTCTIVDNDNPPPGTLLVAAGLEHNEIIRFGTDGNFAYSFTAGGQLDRPGGMAFGPDGYLYVCSADAGKVLRYNGNTGAVVDVFAQVTAPRDLAFGPDGDLYVCSYGTQGILKVDFGTKLVTAFASDPLLVDPTGIALGPDGLWYVCVTDGVLRFDATTGALVDTFATLDHAQDLAFGPDGLLYVTCAGSTQAVVRINPQGQVQVFAADATVEAPTDQRLAEPRGLTFGPDDNLYVCSVTADAVMQIDGTAGTVLAEFTIMPRRGDLDPVELIFADLPPVIDQQPADATATEGGTAEFRVLGGGTPGLFYQWTRNGEAIDGATGPVLTLESVTADDNNSTYFCFVSNYKAQSQSDTASLTVQTAPTVQFATSSSSGQESATSAVLQVSLTPASDSEATVHYSVTGGTASGNGVDYTLPAGTLHIPAHATSAQIPFTVGDDLLSESDETITVTLSSPLNAVLGANTTHTYTILDNDAPGGVSGIVWDDADTLGVQDVGELGLPTIAVRLLEYGSDEVLASTATATDGTYSFGDVPPGTYVIEFELPPESGRIFAPQDQGGDDTKDSDANPASGRTGPVAVTTGGTVEHVDAGMLPGATIGDLVWHDANADGVQDTGELGLADVTVRLLDGAGATQLAVTTTNSAGLYAFEGLLPGSYIVEFVLATGPAFSPVDQGGDDAKDSDANPTTGRTDVITLAHGDTADEWDAGVILQGVGSIGDLVWNDADGNGIQNSESGQPGVTVNLLTDAGTFVTSTTTDSSGYYSFTSIPAGAYIVEFIPSSGQVLGLRGQGTDSTLDSDANPFTGRTQVILLAGGAARTDIDAAMVSPASIGDSIWNDLNYNGIQDTGETALAAAVTVTLRDAATLNVLSTVPASAGAYSFGSLPPGDYVLQFTVPSGHLISPKHQGSDTAKDSDANPATTRTDTIHLAAGQALTSIDVGMVAAGTLGGYVWRDTNYDGIRFDESVGPDVEVRLLAAGTLATLATQRTGSGGAYSFANLPPGDYVVEFVKPSGWLISPKDQGGSDAVDSDADPATGRTASVHLTAGQTVSNVDAGMVESGTVGDLVWLDADDDGIKDTGEPGLAGVTVYLLNSTTLQRLSTATSGANGAYTFTAVPPGRYIVEFTSLPGYVLSPKDQGGDDTQDSDADPATGRTAAFDLAPAQVLATVDAGMVQAGSIGNLVWRDADYDGIQDTGETGVAGVTVTLLKAGTFEVLQTAVTSGLGGYSFANLGPGSYVVEVVPPTGYIVSPANQGADDNKDSDADSATGRTAAITLTAGATRTDVDAGLLEGASIDGMVWFDNDLDGIQDAGELGVTGATVNLLDATGQTILATRTTATGGTYLFDRLAPGTYRVGFVPGSGNVFTLADRGENDALDSDADPATGKTGSMTLVAGAHRQDEDAGLVATAAIGDLVWLDVNKDGIQDAGEFGVLGVRVRLLDAAGAEELAADTTDADGHYAFAGLTPGQSYTLAFVLPPGYQFSPTNATGEAADSDPDPQTGRVNIAAGVLQFGQTQNDWDAGIYFRSEGAAEPFLLKDIIVSLPASDPDQFTWVSGTIYFTADDGASGRELWKSDGTEIGTVMVKDINPGSPGANPTELTAFNGRLFFAADDGVNGRELWKTDGTEAGTVLVKNINTAGDSTPTGLTVVGGTLFFAANDGATGNELWNSDGTEAGTALVKDILSGAGGSNPESLVAFNGQLVFTADDGSTGRELWRSDGTEGNTVQVADINGSASSSPAELTAVGSLLFFAADDGTTGAELWKYDPATRGVSLVKDIHTDGASAPAELTAFNGQLFFSADDGSTGRELWTSDGTEGNTALVQDINPGGDATPQHLTPVGSTLYFSATDGINGTELWKSDGTSAGTAQVADIWDSGSSSPADLAAVNGVLFFSAYSSTTGRELWRTDGLSRGTTVMDLYPGTDASDPLQLANVGGHLLFSADDGTHGREPWMLAGGPASIGGFVWEDANGDGLASGDSFLQDVTVELFDASGQNLIDSKITDWQGTFLFSGLPAGDYRVRFVLADDHLFSPNDNDSTADPVTGLTNVLPLMADENRTDVNTGMVPGAMINGLAWDDIDYDGVWSEESGLPGVTVNLLNSDGLPLVPARSVQTDTGGNYAFSGLPAGDYIVQFVLPTGYAFSPAGQDSDADSATGRASVTVAAGQTGTANAGLVQTGSIGDRVWNDVNLNGAQDVTESGLAGVTVNLLDGAGLPFEPAISTTTDTSGAYAFAGLVPGSYVVEFVLPNGLVRSPQNASGDGATDSDAGTDGKTAAVALAAAQLKTDVDAGMTGTATVSGMAWYDANYNGLNAVPATESAQPGVTVRLLDSGDQPVASDVVTDAQGLYTFTGVVPGAYSIEFVPLTDHLFGPADQGADDTKDSDVDPVSHRTPLFTLIGYQTLGNVDAGLVHTAAIGGMVWNDINQNGLQDGGAEGGIANVSVALFKADGTPRGGVTTVTDGVYSFGGLEPGTYYVEFSLPADLIFTANDVGVNDLIDSDADPTTGRTGMITVAGGATRTDIDAGSIGSGSIGDLVWNDRNFNGTQDAGEPGVSGVLVRLLNGDDLSEIDTVWTASDGHYVFPDVPAGTYVLAFELPDGYQFAPQNQGANVGADSNADPQTGRTATVSLATGVILTDIDAGMTQILVDLGDAIADLGGTDNRATAISDSGAVAGFFRKSADGSVRAFLVDGGSARDLTGAWAMATGVAEIGGNTTAVGHSLAGKPRAFMTDGARSVTDLAAFAGGGSMTMANAISTAGHIAGAAESAAGRLHACLWSAATPTSSPTDLGTLGGNSSQAYAVNASGQVAGDAQTNDGRWHAFRRQSSALEDIDTLNSPASHARGINADGRVVGYLYDTAGMQQAFLFNGSAMVILPGLGGGTSAAMGIDNSGRIVGWATTASGDIHAALWTADGVYDLNRLVPSGSDWVFESATAINGVGQIVGYGYIEGLRQTTERQAFLLTLPAANLDPTVSIRTPVTGAVFAVGDSVTVTANAIDIDGEVASVQFFDGVSSIGSVTSYPYTITWSSLTAGVHNLTANVVARDGRSASSTAVPVTIASGLVANADAYAVDQFATLTVPAQGVLANDVATGSPNAERVTAPAHGTLSLQADGSFTYTPAPRFSGTDTFTYRVVSGQLRSAPATVTLTVNRVQVTFALNLAAGWTLISIPIEPVDGSLAAVLQGHQTGVVWEWQGTGYSVATNILPKGAYWVYNAGDAVVITVVGFTVTDPTRPVNTGWNLIAPVAAPSTPVANPPVYLPVQPEWLRAPEGLFAPPLYGWGTDGAYEGVREMNCGGGYWLNAKTNANLSMAEE